MVGRRIALVTVMLTLGVATVAQAATLTLSKSSTPPGTSVGMSGTGFAPGETVDVRLDAALVTTVSADPGGGFSGSLSFDDTPVGQHTVTATGRSSDAEGRDGILIRAPWPMVRGNPANTGVNPFEHQLGEAEMPALRRACLGTFAQGGAGSPTPIIWSGMAIAASQGGRLVAFDSLGCFFRWVRDLGSATQSEPAIGAGNVIVGTLQNGILAFDARTGAPRWHHPETSNILGGVTVSGGVAYVGTNSGVLYALDAATGAVRWSRQFPKDPIQSAPTVAGGRVFVHYTPGLVRAFRASDGAQLWTRGRLGLASGEIAASDGALYVGGGTQLYRLRARDGRLDWQTAAGPLTISSSPAVNDGRVWIRTRDRTLRAFDAAGGGQVLAATMGGEDPETGNFGRSSPTIADGVVWVTSSDRRLYAFDEDDATLLRSIELPGNASGAPAVSDGRVWMTTSFSTALVVSFTAFPP
jgi:outer membrane protein assembly factor BamB